jgi:hypothetical protein
MLRIVVAILLGANVLYAAYQWGWLATIGVGSAPTSEARTPSGEVAPERIVIVAPAASEGASQATSAEAGQSAPAADDEAKGDAATAPATTADATAVATKTSPTPAAAPSVARLCRAVDALPPDLHAQAVQALEGVLKDSARWTSTESLVNGRWIVYIGKLTEEQLQTRRAQLRAANIDLRVVTTPRLAPGLALGTYSSPERARKALETVRNQGVRDARVEQERAPTRAFALQINDLTPDELAAIESQDAFKDKTLQPCP